MVNINMNIVKS